MKNFAKSIFSALKIMRFNTILSKFTFRGRVRSLQSNITFAHLLENKTHLHAHCRIPTLLLRLKWLEAEGGKTRTMATSHNKAGGWLC